jgi:hypothetical protein
LVSDGEGTIYFLNAAQREETRGKYESPDSHTSIADYFGFSGEKEDKLNKYEYNPLTKKFTVDQINADDDREVVERKCRKLNIKLIVPGLVVKPIVNPLKEITPTVTEEDIKLLEQWASVRDSVGDSVRDSVRDSVWDSVRDSVGDSVRDSVGDSVWDSVWDSVRDSVWDSVRDSVGAYFSTFFKIKYKFDFSSAVKLWEKGLIASFDGKKWRLHGGGNAKILWEGEFKQNLNRLQKGGREL